MLTLVTYMWHLPEVCCWLEAFGPWTQERVLLGSIVQAALDGKGEGSAGLDPSQSLPEKQAFGNKSGRPGFPKSGVGGKDNISFTLDTLAELLINCCFCSPHGKRLDQIAV